MQQLLINAYDFNLKYARHLGEDLIYDLVAVAGPARKVLSYCVLDPYKMGDLRFATLERLSSIFVDFLVLIPSYMDAHRNEALYTSPTNTAVEDFLGNPNWRDDRASSRGEFGTFIVDQFGRSMQRLGFLY